MATARLLGIRPHDVLHGQGRIAGPHGVVLRAMGAPNRAMMPSPMT
jgi:hypothetical protein